MKTISERIGVAVLAVAGLTGCQTMKGLQADIGGVFGKTNVNVPTSVPDAVKVVTGAAKSTVSVPASAPAPAAKPQTPKTPVEICAANGVVVNPAAGAERTHGNFSVPVTGVGTLEMRSGVKEGPLFDIFNAMMNQNITSAKLAVCTVALVGKKTPGACIQSHVLVVPNVSGGQNQAPQGYGRVTYRDKDGQPIAAFFPKQGSGLFTGTPKEIAACHRDLRAGLVAAAP